MFGIHDSELSLAESDINNLKLGRGANEFMFGDSDAAPKDRRYALEK